MSSGKIVIDLLLKTGSFETDSKKAQAKIKGMETAFTGAATKMASAIGITSLSLGGVATAAIVWANSVSKAGREIGRLSSIANASTQEFQKWTYATKSVGIEQDKLSDILKDVSDKTGEFLSTGGGEMKDFFDNIAPKVGVTAEQFARLSGPEALELYYTSLQKAGLGQKQITFYMEALANDASALVPLLKNNGEELNRLGKQAENYGLIMSDQAIAASKEFQMQLEQLSGITSGYSTIMANEAIPILNDFMDAIINGDDATQGLSGSVQELSKNNDFAQWFDTAGLGAAKLVDILVAVKNGVKSIGQAVGMLMIDLDLLGSAGGVIEPFISMEERAKRMQEVQSKYQARGQAWGDFKTHLNSDWYTGETENAYLKNRGQSQIIAQNANNPLTLSVDKHIKSLKTENLALADNTKAKEKNAKATKDKLALTVDEIKILQRVQALSYNQNFGELEKQFNLPKGLLGGLIAHESGGLHKKSNGQLVTSPVGAKGYGQFMPDTRDWAKGKGWGDAYKEDEAAKVTAQYMRYLLDKFNGNVKDAVNAYNWGEGNVSSANKRGSSKRPSETNKHWAGVQKWQSLLNNGNGEAQDTQGLVYAEKMQDLSAGYLIQQQEALAMIGKRTEAERVLAEIQLGKYGQLSEQQQQDMLNMAQTVDDTQKMADQQQRYAELVEMATGADAIANHLADVAMLKDAWEHNTITAEQYQLAVARLDVPEQLKNPNDWLGGMKEGFKSFTDSAGTMRDQFAGTTEDVLNQLGNGLAEFIATGKQDFRGLTVSILQDLSRVMVQMAIVQAAKAAMTAMGFSTGGMVQGYATGGAVWGAGTSTSDSIPALLSNGEFVVNAAATAKNRPLLEAINNNRYATGGAVGDFRGVSGTGAAASVQITNHITVESSGDSEKDGEKIADGINKQLLSTIDGRINVKIDNELRHNGKIYNQIKNMR